MSDWAMYLLEDIAWDEFGGCDDNIVPDPASKQGIERAVQDDCHKNRKCEAITAVRKEDTDFQTLKYGKAPMLETGSCSHTCDNAFPDLCETDCIKEVTSLASDDANVLGNCFESSITNEFCENDGTLGNRGALIERYLFNFPLGNISPSDSDLEFLGTEDEVNESRDLLYYGWPDIGNFEDVDNIFRSCDSTFGQGNASNDGELSWFSSPPHAFNASKDAPVEILEDKMEKFCQQKKMQDILIIDPQQEDLVSRAGFTDQILNVLGGYSEVGIRMELPGEVGSSTVQESSYMSSEMSDEISLEATTFQHLHSVMEKLDIRTKLCIRDSLYRLAKNAEQRLTFGNVNGSIGGGSGLLTTEESDEVRI